MLQPAGRTNRFGGKTCRRLLAAIASVTIVIVPVVATQTPADAASNCARVASYTDPAIVVPNQITVGPDGALWFTSDGNDVTSFGSIGRITTDGTVTNYTDPTIDEPEAIAAGPDGALWFTQVNNAIGRITTDGTVTSYTDPTINQPEGISAGPDGALWFTNFGNNSIGRITTEGSVTSYTDPTINQPFGITLGPDGALWFNNGGFNRSSIARITTGGAITSYPTEELTRARITAGPDGALWFIGLGAIPLSGKTIGRVTTDGTVTYYTDPTLNFPSNITSGPDGALWFTNGFGAADAIGRITTEGTFTFYTNPSVDLASPGITAGPDGALWFATGGNGSIERTTVPPQPCVVPVVVPFGGSVSEGDVGTTSQLPITVTLSEPTTQPVTARWNTVFINGASDVQAIPGIDYIAASGTVTFPPGATTETVPITVRNHDLGMPYKLLVVSFHNPTDATMGGFLGLAFGFIGNIPPPPPVVVPSGGSVTEGAPGTTSQLPITVTLSHPYTQTVTAQWNTAFADGASDVQAVPNTDYTPASGTVTFPPGETTETVPITVLNHDLGMPFKVVLVSFHDPTNATIGGLFGVAFGVMNNNTS